MSSHLLEQQYTVYTIHCNTMYTVTVYYTVNGNSCQVAIRKLNECELRSDCLDSRL